MVQIRRRLRAPVEDRALSEKEFGPVHKLVGESTDRESIYFAVPYLPLNISPVDPATLYRRFRFASILALIMIVTIALYYYSKANLTTDNFVMSREIHDSLTSAPGSPPTAVFVASLNSSLAIHV